jgi:cytoskeletal protein CcmA (bactofilin family)
MTISTTIAKNSSAGNGSTAAFTYGFKITDQSHIKVYIRVDSTGVETLKTLTTHYTVSGVGAAAGGTVTFTSGNIPVSGETVVLTRVTPQNQVTDLVENDPFPAAVFEDSLDKLTSISQEIQETVDRAITVPTTDSSDLELPSSTARASRLMAFDGSGDVTTIATSTLSLATLQAFTDWKNDVFTAGSSQTVFALSGDPGQKTNTQVIIDGVTQAQASYTLSASTITLGTAAPNGSAVEIRYGTAASTYAPDNNSIAYEKLLTSDIDTDLSSVSGSDDTLASAKAIKTYVDAQVDTADTLAEILAIGNTTTTTQKINFRDSGIYLNSSTDGQLDIVADGEVQIAATTIDINGAVALDGAITGATNITLSGELDAATLDISGNADIDGVTNLDQTQIDGSLSVGQDDTGFDVQFYGATSGAYVLWDESADKLLTAGGATIDIVKDKLLIAGTAVTTTAAELNVLDAVTAGTVAASKAVVVDSNKDAASFRNLTLTGELDAATLDISGNADIDGTTNLDAVDIDGAVQADGTITVGVDDTGYDVKFFGATSGKYMLWDESADSLVVSSDTKIALDGGGDTYIIESASNVVSHFAGTRENFKVGYTGVSVNEGGADVDFRVESDGNANMLFVDGGNNKVGIGTNTSDGTLHVHTASAGSVAASADADELVLENSGNAGLSILAAASSNAQIYFGEGTDNDAAFIQYNGSVDDLFLSTTNSGSQIIFKTDTGTAALTLDNSQNATFAGAVTLSKDTSAGSSPIALQLRATENSASWSTSADFAQLQFYSADASSPAGASVRASWGARMTGSTGGSSYLIGRVEGTDVLTLANTGNATLSGDMKLAHDGAVLYFGADSEINLEHVADHGLKTNGHLNILDDKRIYVGTGNDLQIYHDPEHSFIDHTNASGTFYLRSASDLALQQTNGEYYFLATKDGAVRLYFNGTEVLKTLADGWQVPDNMIGKFGSSGDLQLYHNATNSVIFNQTAELRVRASTFRVMNGAENETQIIAVQDAGVAIYYNNDTKMETGDKGAHFPEAIIIASEGDNVSGTYKQYVRALGDSPSNVDLVDITLPNYATASVKVRVTGRGTSALATQIHSEQTYAMSTDTSSVNVHAGTQVDIDTAFTLAVTTSGKNVTIDATASNCGGTQAYVEILTNAAFTDNLS